MIPKIEAVIGNYEEMAGHYRFWPGPNSNTFVAAVLRGVPELEVSLPPTANGKDFKPGVFMGLTDPRTGVEAGLWGILGMKIGWVEGVEINLLSFIASLDLRQPALKLPGFGRIDFMAGSAIGRANKPATEALQKGHSDSLSVRPFAQARINADESMRGLRDAFTGLLRKKLTETEKVSTGLSRRLPRSPRLSNSALYLRFWPSHVSSALAV